MSTTRKSYLLVIDYSEELPGYNEIPLADLEAHILKICSEFHIQEGNCSAHFVSCEEAN